MDMISVEGVSKKYNLYNKASDRFYEAIHPKKKKYHREFHALKDIDFTVKRGENVGIIGRNGAGKSTLLKIITGLISPSEGNVKINGRVSAIIELGAGFNPEYTGIENIYLNGLIKGMTRKEIDSIVDDVIAFSEIGDFMNQPVKTYSSGMYARLAFSVAINTKPDILIVDEALSVGDMLFQHKCMARMKKMMEEGVTILFVSHDIHAIKSLCSKCVYIEKGEMIAYGDAMEVSNIYLKKSRESTQHSKTEITDDSLTLNKSAIESESKVVQPMLDFSHPAFLNFKDDQRYGSGKARIVNAQLYNAEGDCTQDFAYDETITVKLSIEFYETVEHLNVSLLVRDKNGIDITGTTTFDENMSFPTFHKGDRTFVQFTFPNRLKHNLNFSFSATLNETISYEETEILDHLEVVQTFRSLYNPNRPVWYTYYQDIEITYEQLEQAN